MGINFTVYESCGRAECVICNEIIKAGETQVRGSGFQSSNIVHLNCLINEARKKGLKWQR